MEKFFDTRKDYVARFIKSYLTLKRLSQLSGFDEDEDMRTDASIKLAPVASFDRDLEVGQVRLLTKTDRMTYVVLLRRWEDNSFVVMPFSNHSAPATDEEFLPSYDGGIGQRVLQAWNVRTLQDISLRRSWVVDTLPESDVADAWKMWRATLDGQPVEDRLLEKTGLPIYRSDDLRLEYKQRELENFSVLDAEDLAFAERRSMLSLDFFAGAASTALAAGDEKDNPQFTYRLEDRDVECFLEYSRHDKTLNLDVYTLDGQTCLELDGCKVIEYSTGKVLGVIQDAVVKFDYELTEESDIRILDADGNELEGIFEESAND